MKTLWKLPASKAQVLLKSFLITIQIPQTPEEVGWSLFSSVVNGINNNRYKFEKCRWIDVSVTPRLTC